MNHYLDHFLNYLTVERGLSNNTLDAYGRDLARYLDFLEKGDIQSLHKITPAVVRPVRDGRGGHPILLDAVLKPEILDLGDDEPLRNLVRRHAEQEVTIPGSPGTLVDVNTPEDLEAATRTLRSPRDS